MQKMESMEAAKSKADMAKLVQNARRELAAVISTLTELLAAVMLNDAGAAAGSSSGSSVPTSSVAQTAAANTQLANNTNAGGPNGTSSAANTQNSRPKASLQDVFKRFDTLRKAVDVAVKAHETCITDADKKQEQFPQEERLALMQKRAKLVSEVHAKNIKVKLLMLQLRELQRDILTLVTPYYKQPPARK